MDYINPLERVVNLLVLSPTKTIFTTISWIKTATSGKLENFLKTKFLLKIKNNDYK